MAQAQRAAQAATRVTAKKEFLSNRSALNLTNKSCTWTSDGKVKDITFVVMTLEMKGKASGYLVVHVPKKTVDEINKHTSSMSGTERERFVRSWIAKNKKEMIDRYFENRKASSFNIALVPVSSKAVTPTKTPPSRSATPSRIELPKPKTSARPEPPKVRLPPREPSPRPAVVAPAAKVETKPPLKPVLLKGGRGTESNPYVIKVPVPYGTKIGAEVAREDFPVVLAGEGRAYFRLSFRTTKNREGYVTHIDDLSRKVSPLVARRASQHFTERTGSTYTISAATLTATINKIIRRARTGKFETVYKYISVR